MKIKSISKFVSLAIALILVLSLVACGSSSSSNDTSTPAASEETQVVEATAEPAKEAEPVTLKFLSNLPDRASGQGLLEQTLLDNYMKENQNIKIQVEALQDEPYKQKFKAYTASNDLPDMYMVWGLPAFFNPVMKGGLAAELNTADYDSYNFFKGSLDGFSMDGKLYGLPRNTDYMFLYYNQAIFDKNSVKVPTTYEELLEATKAFKAKGITPCAMNGKDRWAIALMIQDLQLKAGGDQKAIYNALDKKTSFATDEGLLKGAQLTKQLMDAKFFQPSFSAADYGAANNLFAQEKAAMYYMGEWETGMASNEKFPESFRKNLHAIPFPVLKDAKGKATDLISWNGGGFAVFANSKVKDEAIKLLNYIFIPDNWAKQSWQMGVNVPAQKFDTYFTGKETDVQKEVVKILNDSTSASGSPLIDASTSAFKEDAQNFALSLAVGTLTPEKYLEELDKAADKAKAESGN
jgi:raffinose/stachyose/melibiose transport system substrate-binding protein